MRVYLVAEPVVLIAEDLAACIVECDPEATVVIAAPGRDVVAAAPALLHAAFLHMDPGAAPWAPLYAALLGRGAELVFLGAAAEEWRGVGRVLESPFSAATVAAVLQEIRPARLPRRDGLHAGGAKACWTR